MEEMSYVFLFTLFCHCRSFSRWSPVAFLIFSPPLQNFHVVLPTKKMSSLFLISRCSSLSLFFSWSFTCLSPTFSFSALSFSFSIFQICGHDNCSKLNTLGNTDAEPICAFFFRLDSLVVSASQDAGDYAIFRQ